jgi:hypothetical protein
MPPAPNEGNPIAAMAAWLARAAAWALTSAPG